MRILITGSNGLLGQKIVKQLTDQDISFLATSAGENRNTKCTSINYKTLDITNQQQIADIVAEYKPTHIINTAAVTNVDYCEDHTELCQKVNVDAVQYLFESCTSNNIGFIHLSTDFIFDGINGPYTEDSVPNPLCYYGLSKLKSENQLSVVNVSVGVAVYLIFPDVSG